MAICLGNTTFEVIDAIRPDIQGNVQVVQAVGSTPNSYQDHDSSSLTCQLAHKLGGEATYLPSPAMADSVEAARVLRSQNQIKQALQVASRADVALVGGGRDRKTEITLQACHAGRLKRARPDGTFRQKPRLTTGNGRYRDRSCAQTLRRFR